MPPRKGRRNVPDVIEERAQKETLLSDLVFDKGGSADREKKGCLKTGAGTIGHLADPHEL